MATNDSRKNVFINLELVRFSIYQFVVRTNIQASGFCFVFQSDTPFSFPWFLPIIFCAWTQTRDLPGMCAVHSLWSPPSRVEPSAILTHIPKRLSVLSIMPLVMGIVLMQYTETFGINNQVAYPLSFPGPGQTSTLIELWRKATGRSTIHVHWYYPKSCSSLSINSYQKLSFVNS